MSKKVPWTTVSIPDELAERIDKIFSVLGYNNRSEFVRDAVHRLLDQVEANLKEK